VPAPSPFAESPEFRRLLEHDPRADLVRVALEIARDAYPGLDPEPYLARIDDLAERVCGRCAVIEDHRRVLGQINWVLFVEEGYRGNTGDYYDPRNSYLNEVIDRKTGIPISLSVLYWRLAERLGLPVAGVNLPAHFMLRVGGEADTTIFVDPFHDGALLDHDGCRKQISRLLGQSVTLNDDQLAPCPTRQVVARMLRNLKSIYLQNHDFPAAVPVQRRLAALNGATEPEELRDLGMLYLHLDRPAEAVGPLHAYLDASPSDPSSEDLRALLRSARRDAATRN
jgi:regulator of sirC expression with transglutaminase-like and TPR domain